MNTSASGGFLQPNPIGSAPLEDDAFVDFLQRIVSGITGLDGSLVRPRWQPEPPNLPQQGANWVAIGITSSRPDTYAVVQHDGAGEGSDKLERHEETDLLTSFYGPNAWGYLGIFRDGLQIAQNRELLQINGMGLVDTGEPVPVPVLTKERWLNRVDLRMTIKRQIRRVYPVLNLRSAHGTLHNEEANVSINVEEEA